MSKPILNQINLVCGDMNASIAFYRRLGMEIPDAAVWRTPSGAHHANAAAPPKDQGDPSRPGVRSFCASVE